MSISFSSRLINGWAAVAFFGVAMLLFPWWLAVLQTVFVVVLWYLLQEASLDEEGPSGSLEWIGGGLLLLGLLLTRLYPFLLAGHPLGYDTGIYRAEIWTSWQALPEYTSGLFLGLPLLTNVLGAIGLSVDVVMYGLHLGGVLCFGMALWMLARYLFGAKAALITLFLAVVSLVQFEAYSMLLLKQVLSLSLVLVGFFFVEKRSYLMLLPLFFIALLQPLDAVLMGLSAGGVLLYRAFINDRDRHFFFQLMLLVFLFAVIVFALDPVFWQQGIQDFFVALLSPDLAEPSLQSGVFLSVESYGAQSAFLFLLGLMVWWKRIRDGKLTVFHIYLSVLLGWILLQLFFYQRLLIQLDMVLLLFSGWGLLQLWNSLFARSSRVGVMLIVGVLLALPFGYRLYQYHPLVSDRELAQVRTACELVPQGATLGVSDNGIAPWVRGFCLDQQVFGPALFGNDWSRDEWEVFWEGADEQAITVLMEDLPRPLYFYTGTKQGPLSQRLFEDLGEGMYRVYEG